MTAIGPRDARNPNPNQRNRPDRGQPLKKIAFGLFVLVCLAIVTVLALPSFIDWNTRRDWVERQLSAMLDREVEIAGELDFALLPTPILSAERVRLTNEGGETLADIDTVDLRMALLPLLGGRFAMEQVTLVNPVVDLMAGGAGLGLNATLGEPASADRVRLDSLTLENGTLRWLAPDAGREIVLDGIFAQISADSLAGPFTVVGGLNVDGRPVSVELAAGRLSAAGAWPMTIDFGLDGSGAEGRYSGLVGLDGHLQGDLSVEGGDLVETLGDLFAAVDLPTEWAQPFSLSARLAGRDGVLDVNGLEFAVAETRASGGMAITLAETPTVAVNANINRVDLARSASEAEGRWLSALTEDRWPLPAGLRLTTDLSIGALGLGGTPVRQVRLNATLADGALSISRLTAQMPGGTDLRAVGTVGPGEDGRSQADIAVEMASGDLRRLLTWAGLDVSAVPGTRLRAFNGRAAIVGRPDDLQITGLDVVVDTMRLSGGLAFRDQGRPGLGLRLEVDDLNLDAYVEAPLAAPGEILAAGAAGAADLDAIWPALAGFDVNLDVSLGRVQAAGLSVDRVHLVGTLNRGRLDVRDASIADFEGASVELSGRIEQVWPIEDVDLTLDLAAADPRRVLDALGIDLDWPIERLGAGEGHVRVVGGVDRLDLEARLGVDVGDIALGGSIADPIGRPVYDLATRITHDDLLQVIQVAWPSYAPRGDLGALDLYATIEGTNEALTFGDLVGQLGEITVGGQIRLDSDGARPSFDVALGTNHVSVEPFLPWPEPSFVAPGQNRWSTQPFDWPDLSAVDGHLLLTAGTVELAGMVLDAPALEGGLDGGVFTLSQASAGLFGGQAGLSGRVDFDERTELDFDFALANADLGRMLRDGAGIDGASGTLDLALRGAGRGESPADLVADLSGEGLLAVRDGTVDRLDLATVSDRLGMLEDPLEFLEVVRGPLVDGTTAFAAFNAPLTVDAGVIASDAVRWRADAGLGEGSGSLDLTSLVFNALLDVTLFAHPDAPPFAIEFSGSLDRLQRSLDTDALSAWVAQRAAEALTDRLRAPEAPAPAPDGPPRPLVPDAGGVAPSDDLRTQQRDFDPAGDRLRAAINRPDHI